MKREPYPTDLTDYEWQWIAPLLPRPTQPGRPCKHSLREILNAIFYVIRMGCQWRLLPYEFPAWKTTYHYFCLWRKTGIWEQMHHTLREQLHVARGRNAQPSAGIIDSQGVKTTGVAGERGYDGAKKVKGRKRHVLVDTQGLELTVKVQPADVMDRDGVMSLLAPIHIKAVFPRLRHLWLDAGYNGKEKGKDWIEKHLGWTTHVVKPPPWRVLVLEHVEPYAWQRTSYRRSHRRRYRAGGVTTLGPICDQGDGELLAEKGPCQHDAPYSCCQERLMPRRPLFCS